GSANPLVSSGADVHPVQTRRAQDRSRGTKYYTASDSLKRSTILRKPWGVGLSPRGLSPPPNFGCGCAALWGRPLARPLACGGLSGRLFLAGLGAPRSLGGCPAYFEPIRLVRLFMQLSTR